MGDLNSFKIDMPDIDDFCKDFFDSLINMTIDFDEQDEEIPKQSGDSGGHKNEPPNARFARP